MSIYIAHRRRKTSNADDVSDDALRWLVNLNTWLSPKLSRLLSVFGLSEKLIQKVKRHNDDQIAGGETAGPNKDWPNDGRKCKIWQRGTKSAKPDMTDQLLEAFGHQLWVSPWLSWRRRGQSKLRMTSRALESSSLEQSDKQTRTWRLHYTLIQIRIQDVDLWSIFKRLTVL